MKDLIRLLRDPAPASAPSGGGTGDYASASADASTKLLEMMAPPDAAASAGKENVPATPPAEGDPEAAAAAAAAEPGQADLSAEDAAAGDEPAAGADGTELSEAELLKTLPPEIAKLPKGERTKLLTEMAAALKSGESVNGLLRGHKYAAKLQEQIDELRSQVAGGAEAAPSAPAGRPLPEHIAKLKTVAEVNARRELAETNADALQDFLDANPGQADTVYTVGDQQLTRQQIVERRAQWRAEAKALPVRAQQIEQGQQFQVERRKATAQIVSDFPVLNDPEHPETQLARQFMGHPEIAKAVNGDYLALALARGHTQLQAELAARKAGKAPGAAAAAKAPAGGIQKGKPAGGASAAAPRSNGAPDPKAALKRAREEKSQGALANLVEAMG